MSDLHMEPGVVERCAGELAAGADVIRAAANGFTVTGTVVARDGALATTAALQRCRDSWSRRIADDGSTATVSAEALRSAVREYQATDERHAAEIRGPVRGF